MTVRGQTWCNPIVRRSVPDPFILPADGAYFLFGTGRADPAPESGQSGAERFIQVFRSDDLIDWTPLGGAVSPGPPGAWNRRNFWAPELLAHGGRYWLYYTAMPDEAPQSPGAAIGGHGTPGNTGNRVGLAVADAPAGPYADRGVVVSHASLDGSPFRDADGSLYLYYTAEFGTADGMTPGRIYADRLVSPARAANRPVELIGQHRWQEGPCVLARGGRYWLFYSTGNWGDATYRVRYAVGDSPLGPFTEQPEPLLATTPQVIGPGHHNFFRDFAGREWIVYHGWAPQSAGIAPGGPGRAGAVRAQVSGPPAPAPDTAGPSAPDKSAGRMPRIDRLQWPSGLPASPGPTITPQRLDNE